MAKSITIVEVGLRDGLQNEKALLDVSARIELARRLAAAGVLRMEIGSFVRPDWIPQMAGTAEVVKGVLALQAQGQIGKKVEFSALVPNERGFHDALAAGVREVAVFTACTDSFSKKNINCTMDESFDRFLPVMALAKKNKIKVRGYLSVCFGCPFEGQVPEVRVVKMAERMLKMGVYEISIGDTIGVAHVGQVESLFKKLKHKIPVKKLAAHFHDTRGQALANIEKAHSLGIRVFDTSLGGLGGCPYAPGSFGNVATEDTLYMFDGMKVKSGLKLEKLIEINPWVSEKVGHSLPSRLGLVGLLRPKGKVK